MLCRVSSVLKVIQEFVLVKTNDMMLTMYMSSMIRCVIALHNLIDNKEVRYGHRMETVAAESATPEVMVKNDEGGSE